LNVIEALNVNPKDRATSAYLSECLEQQLRLANAAGTKNQDHATRLKRGSHGSDGGCSAREQGIGRRPA
jgi:hypothetical protein